jgi:SRSO17 transposase
VVFRYELILAQKSRLCIGRLPARSAFTVSGIAIQSLTMIINHFPEFLQRILMPLQAWTSRPQFAHLRWMVLALVINMRKSKLIHLAEMTPYGGHRTSRGCFLSASWDAPGLLADQAMRLLRSMKPRKGEAIYLLVDDTRIAKRGKKMDALSKIWDHKGQRFVRGHMVVTAALRFRGVTLPWRVALWLPKGYAGSAYRKLTEIAAGMIDGFAPPAGLKVRVLFDALYLAPCVVRACENKGFSWFSVASKNRKLSGRKYARKEIIRDFAPGVLKSHGQWVRLRRDRGWRWMRVAAVEGSLSRLGRVRMVLSKRPRDPWKRVLAVVTNETTLKAREIIAIYEQRWHIEVLFKELRESLGLGDYQVIGRDAIERHLHLVCLTHLVLTHHSLSAGGAQARKANVQVDLPSMNARLAAMREAIRREQLQQLLSRITHRKTKTLVKNYLFQELRLQTAI